MGTFGRGSKSVRLGCETLEDRLTPAVAYALSGVTPAGVANLLAFDTAAPTNTTSIAITGVATDEALVGIDFRPQNGMLYGLGVDGTTAATLYTISTRTGVATAIGATNAVAAPVALSATTGIGFDFNPTNDQIRVVTGSASFRLDPNTGAFLGSNGALNGATTTLDGSAYTNNTPNATTTTLFGIDSTTGALYTQVPASGLTTLVGTNLGVTFSALNGFDILGATTGFAALTVGGQLGLYAVNLTTGTATLVGAIGAGNPAGFTGFAIASDAPGFPAIALNTAGTNLLRFNTASPATVTTSPAIAGVDMNEVLVGIDFRPNTGQLFGLGVNATTGNGTLYRIDPQTAAATIVGALGSIDLATNLPAATAGYGFDFNPTAAGGAGLIRVTTGTGLNFRIQPNDGTVAGTDTPISGSGVTGVTGTAYTNSFGQAAGGATTQYTLDDVGNSLLIQGAVAPPGPNGGVQSARLPVTVGGAALDFTAVSGFDIPAGVRVGASGTPAAGFGYAVLTVGGTAGLYQINLATGAATSLGAVAGGATGLTVGDSAGGVVSIQTMAVTGNEGASVNVVFARPLGGGNQTVTVNMTGGNATPGMDFAATPFTVTFVDGATTATLTIPLTADLMTEGTETATLSIASAPGGVIGAPNAAIITITDTSLTPPVSPMSPPPPASPPPFYSGATVTGGNLVVTGAGVAGGSQSIPVPRGTTSLFTDLNGDGKSDIVLFIPGLAVVVDGATGRFLALATDTTGDGVSDLLIFNADGSTTLTNGRTGQVTTTR